MTDTPVNRNTEMTVALAKWGLKSLKEARTMLSSAKIASHGSLLSGGLSRVQIGAMHELGSYPDMIQTQINNLSNILHVIQTGKYDEKSGNNE